MTDQQTATVLLSGGLDSAACMKFLLLEGYAVRALFIDHGQAAAVHERKAATNLAVLHNVPLEIVTVRGNSRFGTGELVGRNAFLIFTALFFSECVSGLLAIGLHSGTQYYDCSEAFLKLANKLVLENTNGRIALIAPFARWTKKDIYSYFLEVGLELKQTYSCESGTLSGCGDCLSCRDRQGF